MKTPRLIDFQRQFKTSITAEKLSKDELELVRGSKSFSRSERVEVYRYAYRARMIEALAEDFPRVRSHLGNEPFENLVMRYLQASPSIYASLSEISRDFPAFVAGEVNRDGYVGDLARFEWATVLVSQVADEVLSGFESLANLSPAEQLTTPIRLNAFCQLVESEWDVFTEIEPGAVPKRAHTRVIVYPYAEEYSVMSLSLPQWRALNFLSDGVTLANLCERLTHENVSPEEITHWFSIWSQRQIVCL